MDNKRNLAVIPARSGSNVFMFQQIVPSMQRLQSSMVRKFHFYEAVNWHQTQQEHGIRFDLF